MPEEHLDCLTVVRQPIIDPGSGLQSGKLVPHLTSFILYLQLGGGKEDP
jgi:hypothetical protein